MAAEISNRSFRSLLYKGSTTKIIAHFMAWFDGKSHNDVGYMSNNIDKLRSQVQQMFSQGIQYANVDWYGSGHTFIDSVTRMLKAECESRKDFGFCLTADDGMFDKKPATQSATDYLIEQIKYALTTYMTSTQYLKSKDGRYILFEFGMSAHSPDWLKVKAAFPQIAILHRNKTGFSVPGSAGAYAWLDSVNSSAGYLKDYLVETEKHPNQISVPSTWKGFDDRKAKWTKNRVVDERNGQLFLDTIAAINAVYSEAHQLEFLQIVTWNDYEESTAFEPGVENGIVVGSSKNGSTVHALIPNGNTSAVDTIEAYVNDKLIGELVTIDLATLFTSPGTYVVKFREISKAGFVNKWSSPLTLVASYPTLVWN